MGIVFRQSIKGTIITFTGAALGAIIVWVSTSVLSQTEYGLITNITLLAASLQLIIILGTANLIAVYTQRYNEYDVRRKALLTLGALTTFITGILFTILFFAMKEHVIAMYSIQDQPFIRKYYHFVPVVIMFMSSMTIFECYLLAHLKIAQAAFSKEVLLRILNLLLLGMVSAGTIAFSEYVASNALIYIIPLSLMIFMSHRTKGFGFTMKFNVFTRAEFKDMIHFSWYHMLFGSIVTLINFIDTLMLAPLDKSGMKASAIYNVAVVISAFMFMPYRAMAMSTLPVLNQAYIDKDMDKVHDLFPRAGINILIAGIGMFAIIGVNLDNAVAIIKEGYEPIKYLALILMLGKLADMATGVNNELLSISKYYKFNSRLSVLLLGSVFMVLRGLMQVRSLHIMWLKLYFCIKNSGYIRLLIKHGW
jgi:O-antigen/teichoic acid export membrane protein